jgi:hypothetical protein
MTESTTTPSIEVEIWERVIHPRGEMSRATARRLLQLGFSDEEKRRMKELAAKNRAGRLDAVEQAALDDYCRAGTTLSILKSRARQVLSKRRRAS